MVAPLIAALEAATMVKSLPVIPSNTSLQLAQLKPTSDTTCTYMMPVVDSEAQEDV